MSISDQLRKAVREHGTVYAAARDSGVSQTSLNRFMRGERSLSLEAVDQLAAFFGMHLTRPTTKPAKSSRGRPKRQ